MKKRLSKKTYVKRISAVLIAVLLICALPAEPSYGLLSPLSQVGAPAKVTTFKSTAEDAAGLKYTNSGVLNKNMEICVKDGQVKILRYMDVINYNRQTMEIGGLYDTSLYLDNSLEDIRFVLRNPATGVYSSITAAKQSYIRSVASRITAGITADYEKLRAIYEYTAGNFYYDSVAFQTHNNQYCDPYENIFSFETGRTGVNSQNGRVYTTCQGYSAIFIALARAQGIPAGWFPLRPSAISHRRQPAMKSASRWIRTATNTPCIREMHRLQSFRIFRQRQNGWLNWDIIRRLQALPRGKKPVIRQPWQRQRRSFKS